METMTIERVKELQAAVANADPAQPIRTDAYEMRQLLALAERALSADASTSVDIAALMRSPGFAVIAAGSDNDGTQVTLYRNQMNDSQRSFGLGNLACKRAASTDCP